MTSSPISSKLVGYAWLSEHAGVSPVQPLRKVSMIGGSRRSEPGREIFPMQYQPSDGPQAWREHFRFALAHEDMHLELMARLFGKIGADPIEQWLKDEPTGSYARRAGFFYEWLTGRRIDSHERVAAGNYVDAIDAQKYLAATVPVQDRRWRVNDNLPGSPTFCPMVRLDEQLRASASIAFEREVDQLVERFGEDLILRSVSWLSVKESRASFKIEREVEQEDRIHRFAKAMAQYCGALADPLELQALVELQKSILGDAKTTFALGLRRSPVFVGHTHRFEPVVDYVAPHHDMIAGMLEGLREFARRTAPNREDSAPANAGDARWLSSVVRAAVLSFGFVYIHPMADGNGRISRFLINDTLRRDGALPRPLILPVSAIISDNVRDRDRYDQALEVVSQPLMASLQGRYGFDRDDVTVYEDGVRSNFHMQGWQEAAPAWRYLDLTRHAAYLGEIIRRSMDEGIADEASYLQKFDRARNALQTLIEARDEDAIRIIRGIVEHQGVSKSLRKFYPELLEDASMAAQIESAVLGAFAEDVESASADDVPRMGA